MDVKTTADQARQALRRLLPWLPWFNLAWGIGSAFFITRSLSDPTPVLWAGLTLIALTFLMTRVASSGPAVGGAPLPVNSAEESGPAASPEEGPVDHEPVRSIETSASVRKQKLVKAAHWGASMAVQNAAQYTLAFTLPLLVIGGNTLAALVSLPFTAVSLWDPWWERIHRHPLFLLAIRTWTMAVLVSVLCSAVIPNGLALFFPLQIVSILAASGFWADRNLYKNARQRVGSAAITILFLVLCALQWSLVTHGPFPAIGVWVRSGGFTKGKPVFIERERIDQPLPSLSVTTPSAAAPHEQAPVEATKVEICCVTPIIGGRGFRAQLSHRWLINGALQDEIALPPAAGNGEQAAFRTYSCKRNFPEIHAGDTVVCQTLAQGRVVLGTISLSAVTQR